MKSVKRRVHTGQFDEHSDDHSLASEATPTLESPVFAEGGQGFFDRSNTVDVADDRFLHARSLPLCSLAVVFIADFD